MIVSPVSGVTFTGSVYEGALGDTGIPVYGVTLNLYGSNTYGVQGTGISQDVTNRSGFYSLEGPDTWEYNNIILEIPMGATAVGAQSLSGSVLTPTWIVVPYPAVQRNPFIAGNDFWIERTVTCPAGCKCLSVPAATEKYLTFERCSGDICGYDAPDVPRYCMRPVTVTTIPGPADGTPCEDGNLCTSGDVYQNGVCVSGTPLICDDQNPDTTDTCDPGQGCIFTAKPPVETDCTCMLESEAKTRFIHYTRCNDTPCGSVPVPQNDPCLYCNMFPQYCDCTEDPGHCVCDQYTQYYFRSVPLAIVTPRPKETVPLTAFDSDRDGVPDINDNCPSTANPNQADSEVTQVGCMPNVKTGGCIPILQNGDGVGDACDNCPSVLNADQSNFNNNAWGDACDCWDVFQSTAETGVDCGGVCGDCVTLSWEWKNITPIRLKGGVNQGFIDIVFIPNTDYASNPSEFRSDVINLIRTQFFRLQNKTTTSLPQNYKDRFNFYLYEGGFGNRTDRWNLPSTFWTDAPGTDVGAILKNSGCCVGESFYFGPPAWLHCPAKNANLCMHEFGHAIFSLLDEYCGITNYDCTNGCPAITNVWSSTGDCQKDAAAQGWRNGTCRQIEWDNLSTPGLDCQQNFWRYDPVSCEMDSNGDLFGEACSRKISHVYNNWPSGLTKGILVTFHVKDGIFSYVSSEVVASHPDLGLQGGAFTGTAYSSRDEVLGSFGVWDSREGFGDRLILDAEGGTSRLEGYPVYRDDFDFPVIFPFYDNLKTFRLENSTSHELMVEVSLTSTLRDYCDSVRYNASECRSLDLDNDGIRDFEDRDPLSPAAEPIPGFTFVLGGGGLSVAYLVMRKRR
jgi:Thrombospondin type 3 repeat.